MRLIPKGERRRRDCEYCKHCYQRAYNTTCKHVGYKKIKLGHRPKYAYCEFRECPYKKDKRPNNYSLFEKIKE